jgi:hypothetical protein
MNTNGKKPTDKKKESSLRPWLVDVPIDSLR